MIADVAKVWREYVRMMGWEDNYWAGRMELALVMVGRTRMLREIEGTSLTALSKEEIISTLESLMGHLAIEAEQLYDRIDRWRAVRFSEDNRNGQLMIVTDDTGSSSAVGDLVSAVPLRQGS